MDKRLLTLLLVCMCATLGIQARTVKGTVVDKVNQPVIGASVHVNGTNLGAMTDVDGNFTISNAPDNAVLTFSYVGMVSKTVKAADGQMKIELADDVQNLEEVVVIGYGAAKAKDLTAPIEVVKGEKLIATPSSSPMTALQGKVAGVNIVNSGTPGDGPTVTIRGLGSFGNTTPLYVVDGMFYDNINFLNNADIQDLTIMKDASAAAIYGVRAANGVVIITTKKGAKNQDAKVTYNGYVGFQKATNVLEMCNSHEYATMLTEADKSAYSYMFENSIKNWGGNMNDLTFGADTDWYSELLRTAMITNHSLSVTGGTQKTAYAVGMSYLAQDGVMDVENYYRRLNFRASLDFDATNWLKVGFNGVFSNGDQRVPNNNAWQQAFNAPGIYPVYDTTRDSKIYTGGYASPEQIGVTNNFYNPVATANYFDSKNDTYQVLSNFYAQFQLVPDRLNFRTSYAYDYANTKGMAFTPIYCVGSVNQHNDQTSLTKSESTYKKWVWDNVLTYNQTFDKHHFNAMAGFSMRNERYYFLTATAKNVPEGKDAYKYLNLGSKEGVTVSDDGKNEGEHCPIFYKKNRFVLIESGNFALSENPNVYGVKGWDASYPRIATWAILKDRKTGKKIAYFNTHLDNDGVQARREGIKLVLERAKQIAPKLPLLISGDFNCTDANAPFDILNAAGLKSIYQLSPIVYGPKFSYHDYGRAKPEELELLDYVFVSKAFDVKRCRVIQDKPEGHYLSDHYPVIAQIQY